MFCPFDLSSQKDSATRKNLDLRLSEDWENRNDNMESNLISLVVGDSEKQFTEKLAAEEIQQHFKGTLHKNGEYSTNLRVKVQTKGARGARQRDKQNIC